MEVLRALACLTEPPGDGDRCPAEALGLGDLGDEAAWHELFVLQLPPYASIYLGAEGMLGGEARDRIAGTWRAVGLTPPDEPDHLAVLLAAYASLTEDLGGEEEVATDLVQAVAERRRHLARVFLWDHLLSWLPAYLRRVAEIGGGYRGWTELLEALLAAEAMRFTAPREAPRVLREVPPLADPRREGGERFVAGLLAPAVSGMVIARADLERLGREMGLGVRRGERAYALKALLSQDAPATLAWLAGEARRAGTGHRDGEPVWGSTAMAWAGRAEAAAGLLDDLAESAAAPTAADEPTPRPTHSAESTR